MRFQRLMWLQVFPNNLKVPIRLNVPLIVVQMKKVNDHLAGLEYNDRAKLGGAYHATTRHVPKDELTYSKR